MAYLISGFYYGGGVRHNWKPFCVISTTFSQQVEITLSKCLRVWQVF